LDADSFISQLPSIIVLGEFGANLSGGQVTTGDRQSDHHRPTYPDLDESTAGPDPVSESLLERLLNHPRQNHNSDYSPSQRDQSSRLGRIF